jgi:hypothetical protein
MSHRHPLNWKGLNSHPLLTQMGRLGPLNWTQVDSGRALPRHRMPSRMPMHQRCHLWPHVRVLANPPQEIPAMSHDMAARHRQPKVGELSPHHHAPRGGGRGEPSARRLRCGIQSLIGSYPPAATAG